ncbi:MAG TPA: TonB C-terminal domain-containing protein [Kofleriaceae bacterium]|nr:TonB C-terminal domain-containing protein [Kofleriaceae bacterium]
MNKDLHVLGFCTTALVHAAVITLFFMIGQKMGCSLGSSGFDLKNARYVEAALAKKGPEKEERQPQKRRRRKVKPPDVPSADRDENKQPQKKPEKKKPKPKDIDWMSQLEDNRKLADDLPEHGTDLPDLGNVNGSEWGTEDDARGDPYVGELKGRIFKAWQLPTLVAKDFEAVGCVRLDSKGKIKVHELLEPSKNAKVDQSVKQALKNATPMEEPVPAHLVKLLTEQGICFKFHP